MMKFIMNLVLTFGICAFHLVQGAQGIEAGHKIDLHNGPPFFAPDTSPLLELCPTAASYACPSTVQPGKKLLCIDRSWLCDFDPDCPEGEDEDTEEGGPCHGKDEEKCSDYDAFKCKSDNLCIPVEWMCDGDSDCADNSDEDEHNCPQMKLRHLIPCPPDQFQCDVNFKCIPINKTCDGNYDCDSGHDELGCVGDVCESFDKNCINCYEVPNEGAKCDCGEGKLWNENTTSCIDLDECKYEQFCDQPTMCANKENGFTCDCVAGYQLVNNTICKAQNDPASREAVVVMADEWNIRRFDVKGNNMIAFDDKGHIKGLNFLYEQGNITWISHNSSSGKSYLKTSRLDNMSISKVPVNVELTTVDSIAVDWQLDNWYFADPVLKRVSVCTPDGQYCAIVAGDQNADFPIAGPRFIVLDPAEGYMYFTDWNSSMAQIVQCNMDGTYCVSLVSKNLLKPNGLAIDYANRHLYWSDMGLRVIERLDLSGNPESRRIIAVGLKVEGVYSLDVFENYLYLSSRHENQVMRIHRNSYGHPHEVIREKVSRPGQIHVFHRQRQPEGTSPCNAGSCKDTNHICVPGRSNGTVVEAQCLCAAGFVKTEDTCTAIPECADICTDTSCDWNTATTASLPQNCTLELCPAKMSYCYMSDKCLPSTWWCNRQVDCPSAEDEGPFCKYDDCLPSEFRCATSGRCIDITYKCDKNDDCGDGSDEKNCMSTICEDGDDCPKCEDLNLFQCKEEPYMCIPPVFLCNGFPDCFNGSDEEGCDEGKHPLHKCTPGVDFTCNDGQCISLAWRCDDEPDCDDGSDEGRFCADLSAQCKDFEKPCDTGNRCIPEGWFCDLEPDCLDWSDELDTHCAGNTNVSCISPNTLCTKSGGHLCLKPAQLCDGVENCDGGVDEGKNCTAKACNTKPCSDICYNSPDGYICACPVGQKLGGDKKTCIRAVPVNQLCNQWGICGQKCLLDNQTSLGYRCTCLDGFFLEPDGFTCKPLESDPVYVVFSNRHELRRVDIVSSAVTLKSGLRNTIALDFYYKDGLAYLFWTDVMEDRIYKGIMMGNSLTDIEAIITSGLATTEGVAVDWVGENIYWVESNLDQIEVAKLDGSNRTPLIAGNMSSPRAIVVDPTVGWLFWTDWDGQNPRIERSSMSGELRSVIYTIPPEKGGGWPNGLTADYDFKRVYWIDARSESIHTVNYNGKGHQLILKGNKMMSHPFALSLFGNYVYWTDWSTNSVVRANKFNGSDVQVIQKTITQPFDLQVIHPKRHPYMKNPCEVNNGGCSDLCLINVNSTVGCVCPHRKRLKADGKTCEDDIKFLLFIKDHEIRGVDFEKADFNVIPVITIPHVEKPTAIDYDILSGKLFWADKGLNVINMADFNGVVETLIDNDLENPEGFAIDWLSSNMYFSSYNTNTKKASISVATLAGSFRTKIITQGILQPNSIALHPVKGLLFYTDLAGNPSTHKLIRVNMDGNEPTQLFSDLNQPKSLTVDMNTDSVYFINSGNNTIMSCDIFGKNMRHVVSPNISKPEALTVYGDLLFVSTEGLIVSIKKDGTGYTKLRDSTPNVNALLPYDVDLRKKATQGKQSNRCHSSQHNCTQLCLPKSQLLNACTCTDGYDLYQDSSTCIGIFSFLLYAKETEIRGQKFQPQSKREALPPISNIQSATAVDFHAELDMIYWVDNKANTISRIKRDLTHREVVIREGVNSAEGIAVDWISGNIYWTDAGHSIIEMSKLNGSNRYVITNGDMEKPRSIVVHPQLGYLYWSDWGTDARIERSRLDGSERLQYIFTNISKPWGLTIDYDTNLLYWCDNDLQTINSVNLLTHTRKVLIESQNSFKITPISLTVFNDSIFWLDRNLEGGSIYSVSKLDGGDLTLIRSNLGEKVKDIKSYDTSRQVGTNLCKVKNGGCQELCFYLGNNRIRCDCSYGKLTSDNKTCTEYKGFIMYSKVTGIDSVNLEDLDNMNPPVKHITNDTYLRNVIGLAFDYSTSRIFYSDIQRGDIQKVGFDGKGVQVIVNGIGSAEGLAYEHFNGDLYWTSYTNSCISKINVEDALLNKTRTPNVVIQLSKLDHPRAIVVDSCWKLIYWTNWNNEKPRIQRSKLNGTQDENIIVKDILTPNGLAIDHIAKKLYWSDARLDKIERCDMDGSNRQILLTSIPQHSFGLAVYGDYLFWTDWMLRAIIKVNKYDGTGIVWLRQNLQRQPMGIIAVAEDSNDCQLNQCHGNNGGCQDKCMTDVEGKPFCQCTHGRLKPDGKNCAGELILCF